MPDGVVWWFDARDGEGRILHSGRVFTVEAEDMERSAQVAGARVHFDADSRAPGTATNVTLRPGMRVSRRQRRFGDLTGASRADTKGPAAHAIERPEFGRDLERHPARVAENWAVMLADGRLDDAVQFLAPNVVLHADGEIWTGATSVRSFWSRSPLLGGPDPAGVQGLDGDVFVVRWPATETVRSETETLLTIAHGQIREQRHGRVESHGADEPVPAAIDISTEGDVTDEDRARVVKAVRSVIDTAGDRVLHVSIRLRHASDPAQERPAKSRVTIDLDGEPVRAHASGTTMSEAIDRLDQRLRDRIRHLGAHRRAIRRRGPESPPGEWRHGDWDPPRPPYYPRPVDERSIVRRKASSPVEATLDEAVFDLEAMDHEFLLFQDLATGSDAVVSRMEGGSYVVQYLDAPAPEPAPEGVAAIEIDPRPVPDVDLDGAREFLDLTEAPWVFHRDPETRRGAVLYRRDDGHYGWIRLADDRSTSQG